MIQKTTLPTSTKVIDPLNEAVVVDCSENATPVCIDLNQLFGSVGLRYQVAAETYGFVRVHLQSKLGLLTFYADEYATPSACTRVAIRAISSDGDTVVTIVRVGFCGQRARPDIAA
ncbi:MAG: hypothetical protein ACPGSB_06485 [Opitutales bacterium]